MLGKLKEKYQKRPTDDDNIVQTTTKVTEGNDDNIVQTTTKVTEGTSNYR